MFKLINLDYNLDVESGENVIIDELNFDHTPTATEIEAELRLMQDMYVCDEPLDFVSYNEKTNEFEIHFQNTSETIFAKLEQY